MSKVSLKQLNADGPIPLDLYTVAGLPDATVSTGEIIFVLDESGGSIPAFSDGTDWRRVTDRAVVA
jgi:hypothetical protein